MLRLDAMDVIPVNNGCDAGVPGMDTNNVDTVFLRGKLMQSKGEPVGVDPHRVGPLVHQWRDYGVTRSG